MKVRAALGVILVVWMCGCNMASCVWVRYGKTAEGRWKAQAL